MTKNRGSCRAESLPALKVKDLFATKLNARATVVEMMFDIQICSPKFVSEKRTTKSIPVLIPPMKTKRTNWPNLFKSLPAKD